MNGISFLYSKQLKHGEFETMVSSECSMEKAISCLASSPYVTTFVLHSISFIRNNQQVNQMTEKSLSFLLNSMEDYGTWRFYPKNNKKIIYRNGVFEHLDMEIVPDLDDTACTSHVLRSHYIDFPDNSTLFYDVITPEGKFPTWLLNKKKLIRAGDYVPPHNDICCGVNANILMYLGDNLKTKGASNYINTAIISDKEIDSCSYFTNPFVLYYLVSRSFSLGVFALEASRDNIVRKILFHLNSIECYLDDMSIILAIASLLNFDRFTNELYKWIDIIIDFQDLDGSWPTKSFFIDICGNSYGSKELTTAIALEVIAKASSLIDCQ